MERLEVTEHRYSYELKKFRETLEQLRKECLAQHMKKMDSVEYELTRLVIDSIIQKIAIIPALQLRQARQSDQAGLMGETLNQLFNPEYQDNAKLKVN